MIVEERRFADLDVHTLYGILKLRFDVFVLEQECLYPELDDRDTEIDARHYWIADAHGVAATLRLLSVPEGVGSRIGRLATRRDVRGRGHARRLLQAAIEVARRPVHVSAQAGLEDWYAQFGFTVVGPAYDDGGIDHVPLRLG